MPGIFRINEEFRGEIIKEYRDTPLEELRSNKNKALKEFRKNYQEESREESMKESLGGSLIKFQQKSLEEFLRQYQWKFPKQTWNGSMDEFRKEFR